MTTDPYHTLGLEHDASMSDIKRAYRTLATKLHPDKLVRIGATEKEIQEASNKFTAISTAYTILSDESRKRQYDHIYMYGGFDHLKATPPNASKTSTTKRYVSSPATKRHNTGSENQQEPQKSIGYEVYDPFTFLLSQGKVQSKTVAGITIPSRVNFTRNDGMRLSFSSGQIQKTSSGSLKFTSRTTQYANGKKFSRSETTTIYRDGTKEVVIQGDDYVERRVSTATTKRKRRPSKNEDDLTRTGTPDDETPWYMSAWNGVVDTVQKCTCATISVQ
ncbi:chaperone protein DnaJ [Nitzschia inconspicua]|uniref:Chaperone protein DnaJ n=1 Tax=Nitzschia inconspicua TaxID=303405 RepID=A0A9K3PK38_9STRA|nr:chaperone protein DnaJ [Nitzschia inconspicua]